MGFKCGIVGLPNVGKSTLFNAITESQIEAANFPFCTIEPNVGIVPIPDERLQSISSIAKSASTIPAAMEFIDIAGLVAGASRGEGLGNQFLGNIRSVDAIAQVVRCFQDDNIIHVSGVVDPSADIAIINTELILSDLQVSQSALDKNQRLAKGQNKQAQQIYALLQRVVNHLDQAKPIRNLAMDEQERLLLKPFGFLSAKPMMYIANLDEDFNDSLVEKIVPLAKQDGAQIVSISVKVEEEISLLDAKDRREFLQELGCEEPGLNRMIRQGYDLLGLQTFFTAGPKETHAWAIAKHCTAPQAAGKIHTDMQRGFIKADVIGYSDYVEYQGEAGAKNYGKLRSEGKEYLMEDGDIIHFKFNV